MKALFVSTLLFCFNFGFAQNTNYIESYHKVLLQGDLRMLEHEYDSALYFYQKAFSAVPYAFCFDYLSGSWVAHKAKRDDLALVFLDSAVVRGLYIEKIPRFCFKSKVAWNAYKTTRYPQLYAAGMARHNASVLRSVDSLFTIDTTLRWNSIRNNISDEEFIEQSKIPDSTNAVYVMQLMSAGLAGESQLGYIHSGKIQTILIHGIFENQNFMYEIYSKGMLSKRVYYYCILRNTRDCYIDTKYSSADKTTSQSDKDINRVNDGIPTFDMEKKLKRIKNRYYYPI